MKFERHAFISYAHIDNEPLLADDDGWVTLFHRTLQQQLAMRLGEKANIWRDERLRPIEDFSAEITAKLAGAAVLISVLSPRYLKSGWCRKELETFCELAERETGLMLDNKSRVFKVLTLPLENRDDASLPAAMNRALGYEFFAPGPDGDELPLAPSFGEEYKQKFLRKVSSVAADIKRVMALLDAKAPRPDDLLAPAKPTVYLATCSQDRRDSREMLVTELERLGCTVLPDRQLPTDEASFVEDVRAMLARSRLAVHFVGAAYGLVPEGASGKSVVELQNQLAVQRCREAGRDALARLIWLPEKTSTSAPTLVPMPPVQAAFIQRLHTDAEAQFGADLITADFETLKLSVRNALDRLNQPPPEPPPPGPQPPVGAGGPGGSGTTAPRRRIHLVHCEPDLRAFIELLRVLGETADVTRPVFAGDAGSLRETNQALLMACDEIWLYYGSGDDAWKYHQQNELRRIRGLRTERPLPADTVVLAPPDNDDKAVLVEVGEPGCVVLDLRAGISAEMRVAIGALLASRAPAPGPGGSSSTP